ncbi:hypothetical protein AOQ71_19585 [Bradyrhizobium manausense]|uniref:Uncharacterized protein n=1 Tax=Bradyrhizobium manausense TaxID=989370 RepID=A0A0R3DPA8_9BRAD|nr:hypothetical protein [Bradyrhizobium manausense]KRQ10173.1 hypothetical protein AOQ71_19585 [Bradyrhizobium manausense]
MAKPEYLCAMKLKALTRASFEDRYFDDLVELASAAGIKDAEQLTDLFFRFYPDEKLDPVAKAHIPEASALVLRPGRWPVGRGTSFVGSIFQWSVSTLGMRTRLCQCV